MITKCDSCGNYSCDCNNPMPEPTDEQLNSLNEKFSQRLGKLGEDISKAIESTNSPAAKEIDSIKERLNQSVTDNRNLIETIVFKNKEILNMRSELSEIKQLMRDYAQHRDGCRFGCDGRPCTCGFNEAKERWCV